MADADQDYGISNSAMAQLGWAAWSRNAAGHLSTSHAPFLDVAEWKAYVAEETALGYRVFYPPGPLRMASGELI